MNNKPRILRVICLSLLLLCFFFSAYSQPVELILHQISSQQGLPGDNVRAILKDSKGLMWFGLDDIGLCKYDGHTFTLYETNAYDINSISNNYILTIIEDREGFIWIGTDGGLNRLDPGKEIFTRFTLSDPEGKRISDNRVAALYEDKQGNIWVGSLGGIDIYDRQKKSFSEFLLPVDTSLGLAKPKVMAFYEDSFSLWIGAEDGLYEYRQGDSAKKWLFSDDERIQSIIKVRFITKDKNGNIWTATDFGLFYYSDETEDFRELELNDPTIILSCMTQDTKGNIWVGSFSSGIRIVDPVSKAYLVMKENIDIYKGLKSDYVIALYTDYDGLVWIGTKFRGVQIYDKVLKTFPLWQKGNGLNDTYVRCLTEDGKGNLWLGTMHGGVNVRIAGTQKFKYYLHRENDHSSISSNRIEHICVDKHGTIWVGTYSGLDHFSQQNETFEHVFNGRIFFLLNDKEDRMWISTYAGIYVLNPETRKIVRFQYPDKLFQSSSIRTLKMFKDNMGQIWFGTSENGLYVYNPERNNIKKYMYSAQDSTSISGNMIRSIYQDKKSRIWVGTKSNGLNLYDQENDRFIRYDLSRGLDMKSIFNILEDEKGNLWMGSANGLIKFNVDEETMVTYNPNYGVQGGTYEFNSYCKGNDGCLYLGGREGLNAFYPDSIHPEKREDPFLFTRIMLFNNTIGRDIKDHQQISLKYNQNYLSFEFAVLDYSGISGVSYSYMMEGLDSEWIHAGSKNFVSYNNLPCGKYTFKVKAIRKDDVSSGYMISYDIIINRPYWKKAWFIILIIFIGLLTVFLFYYMRISSMKIRQEVLARKVEERTVELQNAYLELKQQKEEIATQNEEITATNEEVFKQKEEILAQRDEIQRKNEELEVHRTGLEKLVEERTRDLVQAKMKAEEADKLKSAFLANMSHEIRTPLNAIIGFADLLVNDATGNESKEDIIKVIERNTSSLLNLINDIIDFSKIEAGQVEIRHASFSLNVILQEIEKMYKEEIRRVNRYDKKTLQLYINQDYYKKDIYMVSDPQRLTQILSNLIDNAIKYSFRGTIEVGYEFLNNDSEIRFYVTDEGIGIEEKYMDVIFERFRKIEDNNQRLYRGTGLGLSISKLLVELMHGYIDVESQPGIGSTFSVVLPFMKAERDIMINDEMPYTTPEVNMPNKTILIVEDEDAGMKVLGSIIEKTKANILKATNGLEAVNIFKANPHIDLIFMDIKLPVMDGIEAAREIKILRNDVPIIAQTAYASKGEEQSIMSAGFDGYLTKPLLSEKVMNAMVKFIS